MVRVEYSDDGDLPSQTHGEVELDGFDIVEGASAWPINLAVGEDRALLWRVHANRAGVHIAVPPQDARRRGR